MSSKIESPTAETDPLTGAGVFGVWPFPLLAAVPVVLLVAVAAVPGVEVEPDVGSEEADAADGDAGARAGGAEWA
jgi:hypothetical protein